MKKFTDVELYWASVHTPNQMSGKYQVNLTNLSPERIKWFEDNGMEVRTKESQPEMGTYYTAKSGYPIIVLDEDGDLTEEDVGNGSRADILFTIYETKNKFGFWKGIGIKKIKLTEHVRYEKDGVEDEEIDEVL
jgi:hypothetical protein